MMSLLQDRKLIYLTDFDRWGHRSRNQMEALGNLLCVFFYL